MIASWFPIVYTFKCFPFRLFIFLNSHKSIKEAFFHRGADFADRMQTKLADFFGHNDGEYHNLFYFQYIVFPESSQTSLSNPICIMY